MPNPLRPLAALALLAALAGCTGAPNLVASPAPLPSPYVAPVEAPPPPYEPVAVAPAPALVAYGSSCQAGFYQCLLPAAGPIGSQCSCPGLGAPSYGVVR